MKTLISSASVIGLLAVHHFTDNYSCLVIVQLYYFFLVCVSLFASVLLLLLRTDAEKHKEIIENIKRKTSIWSIALTFLVNIFVMLYFLIVKDFPLSAIACFTVCSTSIFIVDEVYNNEHD